MLVVWIRREDGVPFTSESYFTSEYIASSHGSNLYKRIVLKVHRDSGQTLDYLWENSPFMTPTPLTMLMSGIKAVFNYYQLKSMPQTEMTSVLCSVTHF